MMERKTRIRRRRVGAVSVVAAGMSVVRPAVTTGATFTWDGSTTSGYGYFNEHDNWQGNVAPAANASADLVFSSVNTHGFSPTADTTYSIDSLNFSSSALAYTIGGLPLNIGAGGITDFSPTSATETINSPINLTASQTWTLGQSLASPAGALTLAADQNLNGQTLTIQANGSSALTANLTGTGTVGIHGSGVLTLNGSSSFNGELYAQAGGLIIPAGANVAASQVIVSSSGFNVSGGTVTGQLGFGAGASGPITATIASGNCSGDEVDIGYGFAATLTQTGGTQSYTFVNVGGYASGVAQAGIGTFNLSGGLVNTGELEVGAADAPGVLNQTFGTINASSAFIGTTHNGSATISGASSVFNVSGALTVGATGGTTTASLTVSNGAFVDITGPVSLNSSSAMLNISSPEFFQAASLSGVAGSSVLLTNPVGNSALNMQPAATATGVFRGNISGTGGLFINSSFVNQQLLGSNTFTGPVTVQGGTLEMATGASTAYQVGGTTLTGTLILDFGNLGTSTVTAKSNGTVVYNTSSITGGILAGSGTHNVSSVTSFTGTNFASGSTVNLNTSGTSLTNTLVAGTVNAGAGTTTVVGGFNLSGGVFNNSTGTFDVGSASSATTTAVVTSGTLLYNEISVGINGDAVLTQSGGTMSGTTMVIGNGGTPSGAGTFNLSGGTVTAFQLIISYGPAGILNQTGGTVNAPYVNIGYGSAVGQAMVNGSSASWNINGPGIFLGYSGDVSASQLTVTNGASIVTTGALIFPTAIGSVNISGATVTAGSLNGVSGSTITLTDPAGGTALTLNGAATANYAGNIGGTGSLLYSGSGTQILSGTNTFSGKAVVTSGTLNMSSGSPYGSYQASGGTLVLGFGSLGTSTVRADGTGTVIISAPSVSGGDLAGGGTFNVSAVTSFAATSFLSGSTVNLNTSGTSLTNTLVAGAVNAGTGTTTVLGGFNLSGGAFTNSGGTFDIGSASPSATATAVITSGSLTGVYELNLGLNGPGLLNQSGGALICGYLEVGSGSTPAGSGTFNLSAGTVTSTFFFDVGSTSPGVVSQTGGTINALGVTIGNDYSSPNDGKVYVSGSSTSWNIGGSGIVLGVVGQTNLAQITVSGGASVTTTGDLNLDSAVSTLNISGATVTSGTLYGVSGAKITLADPAGGTALTINGAATATYAGNIGGTGSLLYSGTAHQTLSGTNSFTGKVTVTSGTLEMAGGAATSYQVSGGTLTFDSGSTVASTIVNVAGTTGTATLVNNGAITGTVNVSSGGIVTGNGSAGQINLLQGYSGFFPGGNASTPALSGFEALIQPIPAGTSVVVGGRVNASTSETAVTVNPGDGLTLAGGLNSRSGFLYKEGGGVLKVASLNAANLQVDSGSVQLSSSTGTLVIGNIIFGTDATLDVNKGAAVITSSSLLANFDDVAQGYNLSGGGHWDGTDSITSTAAASDTTHLTAVGVIGNDQSGSPLYSATSPFHGVTPGTNDTLVAYTYFGDANLDGKVDGSDYSLIDAGYASHGTLTGWYYGDFNYDAVIDGSDYALIDNAFNNQGVNLSTAAVEATDTAQVAGLPPTAVPEPGAGAMILAGALFLRRRWRCWLDPVLGPVHPRGAAAR